VEFGLVLTIGKYVFVALIYLFLIVTLRLLIIHISGRAGARAHQPTPQPETPRTAADSPPPQQATAPAAERPVIFQLTATDQPHTARLIVVSTSTTNLSPGLSFPLGKSISIGRKSHNDLSLQDRYVSATHALIVRQDNIFILRDYHSTNGTVHNGVRIQDDVTLSDGDEITIGGTTFRYQALST